MKAGIKKLAIVALALVLVFTGCTRGKDEDRKQKETKPQATLTEIKMKMKQTAENLPAMSLADGSMEKTEDLFAFLSSMEYEKVSDYFFLYAADGTAEEIAVICLKDSADGQDAIDSLKEHVESRIQLFDNYAPEQVPMAEKAEIFAYDTYAVLIIAENAKEVKEAFYEMIEK